MSCDCGDVITALSFDERKPMSEVRERNRPESAGVTALRETLARSASKDISALPTDRFAPESTPCSCRGRTSRRHHVGPTVQRRSFGLGVPFDLDSTEYAIAAASMVLSIFERRPPSEVLERTAIDRLMALRTADSSFRAVEDMVAVRSPGHCTIFVSFPCGVEEGQRCARPHRSCGTGCGRPVGNCGQPAVSRPTSG